MDIITHYFTSLSDTQKSRFEQLQSLYTEWNDKINVISRKDMEHFWEHHVLHSLAIANIIRFTPNTTILDVGTGGGFPGIPLAIMFPDCQFTLIDSIGKKIKVVTEVSQSLGLTNIEPIHGRIETEKRRFDFVVSRAVTRYDDFYKLVKKNISANHTNALKNGILYLKGGDFAEEMASVQTKTTLYAISDFFTEPFFETKKIIHTTL